MVGEGFPMNSEFIPTAFAEGAREDHVFNSFFDVASTQEAVVIISDVIVSSFEHILSIQPIMEKEPSKNLQFHRAL